MSVLPFLSAVPSVLAGVGTWSAAFLILRRRRQIPLALAAAPALAGAVAAMVLRDVGGAEASDFATAWILAPAAVVVAVLIFPRLGPSLGWAGVGAGMSLQLIGIVDGGGAITAEVPGIGPVLTADLCRLALVFASAVIAGPAVRRLPVKGVLGEPRLRVLGACWAASGFLSFVARDLGQAVLTLALAIVLFHLLTMRLKITASIMVVVSLMMIAAIALFPHARERVQGFSSLGRDARVDQGELALFAASSGGLFGVGLGKGGLGVVGATTARDWLLAADARIFGFLGVFAVLGALAAAGFACLRLAQSAVGGRERVAASAAGVWILLQLLVAAAGVFAVVPETGVAPPFFGAGRVPVLVFGAVVGLAMTASPLVARRKL